jgi:lipid-A-disaccharide synthase
VPELIQRDFTPGRVTAEALAIIDDPERARAMRSDLEIVRQRLGAPGASKRAADAILQLREDLRPKKLDTKLASM